MKSFTQALAKTAAVIGETVSSTVHEVTGPKAMQDYELLEQVGSGGPDLIWKLYSGRPRNKVTQAHNPEVCVWVLDKKALTDLRLRVGISRYPTFFASVHHFCRFGGVIKTEVRKLFRAGFEKSAALGIIDSVCNE